MHEYKAKVLRVIDGDTYEVLIDLGLHSFRREKIRLRDVDTPETWRRKEGTPEREHGEQATAFVRDLIDGKTIIIKTAKAAIYGRWEADVCLEDGRDLGKLLIEAGLVKRKSYD